MHPAGRARAGQLAPEHRRQVEADEIVERAAGEIGIDQRGVDLARVLHRLGDGGFGDRVEHHAADRRIFLDRLAFAQRLFEMPRDRLALAVGVGGEDQGVVLRQRVGDRLDVLAAVGADLPGHLEAVIGINRAVFRRQVADMAVGGEHRVVRPEILVDRLGFGRAFDNDYGHEIPFDSAGLAWGR